MFNPVLMTFKNFGTKLSDFEEVPSGDKNYFLLDIDYSSYIGKMKSKKDCNFYAIKNW